MPRAITFPRPAASRARHIFLRALAVVALGLAGARAESSPTLPAVTNVAGLRRAGAAGEKFFCDVRIAAVVCAVSPAQRELVLADDSGAEVVRLDAPHAVRPGEKILLAATGCELRPESWGVSLVPPSLIENDGLHGAVEKSAKVFLAAGRVPVRVEWFNASQGRQLNLAWRQPGGTKEKIPASVLFCRDESGGETNGLAWRGFEGAWQRLPDFDNLSVVACGGVTNFTLSVATRPDFVGLVFEGFLAVARAGEDEFFLESDDGARLFVGHPSPTVTVLEEGSPPPPLPLKPGAVASEFRWVESAGIVQQVVERDSGVELHLISADGPLRVRLAARPPALRMTADAPVTVRGVARETFRQDGSHGFGILEAASAADVRVETSVRRNDSPATTTLVTAEQIERLSRSAAAAQHPAKIRGVITCDAPELFHGNVIQDQSRGIYFFWTETNLPAGLRPHQGEFWEIEGVTSPGQFAPVVSATKMTRLGEGTLPVPVSPAWDQLLNGALDTQFVELQGIITAADTNGVTFLTHGGKIRIDLTPALAEQLRGKKNSLVRLRGCLLAMWDVATHQVKLGEIRLANVSVTADAEAADPFAAPQKSVDDLLLFDMAAGSFQRVNISGQVVAKSGEEFFAFSSGRGFRFVPREPLDLKPGELVEVAGFPELDGPSPVLREAVVRTTGTAPLPVPVELKPEQVARAQNDALRVSFSAVFTGVRAAGGESVLDLSAAGNYFSARLRQPVGTLPEMETGSRMELTGVYVSLDAARGSGQPPGAFELLLLSPSDVKVIARPPWWTPRRLAAMTGALFAVLILAALWITQLRRRVEERTEQLRHEISEREHAEQQRMVAEEKSRIARDLHDDLGASLTAIGLQANLAQRMPLDAAQANEQLGVIADKTRAMVSALDVIVWAVDPEENTLQATAEYICGYAEEFLSASGIDRRFKIPLDLPPVTVDGNKRHGLFLAVKEALNNLVRHARASVVEFGVSFADDILKIEIADNGVGFDLGNRDAGHGVANLQKRLEALGGKCEIESHPGSGTKIKIILPVKK